jgi:hypothetical protein
MNPTATEIEAWANTREAQGLLPILLRRLIHSTIRPIKRIRFPGGDSVLIGGFDGELEVDNGNSWIPEGTSVWECGCKKNRKAKADEDYEKRTKKTRAADRKVHTFVFVTARRWPSKDSWLKGRRQEKKWLDVRCLDADDLEQWLEQAPSAAIWLSEKMKLPTAGFATPQLYWDRWSLSCNPSFPAELMLAGREENITSILSEINKSSANTITIAADSREEALAFLCAALAGKPEADRLLIAEALSPLERLRDASNLVLAVESEAAERRLGSMSKQGCIIVPRARGETDEAHITLGSIRGDEFESCLKKVGLSEDERIDAARESGRSLPILRRRWAISPGIREPAWSGNSELARKLVPFALAGAWSGKHSRDLEALAGIGDQTSKRLDQDIADLLALDDSPLATIGSIHRVVSQIEALFAVAKRVTSNDLDRFFDVAESTLSARDPALDLPAENRWMANVLGKEHPYSDAFLRGIANGLILLSIHGDQICGRRLNFSVSGRVKALVRKLLSNLDGEHWISIRGNLQLLAEAEPDEFLNAIERDLNKATPGINALMIVQGGGVTGTCLRSELLWALETLAWNPTSFHRVSEILARLSQYPLADNWGNKPASSLYSLFRAWLPKTAAPVQQRIDTIRRIYLKYPDVAYNLCIKIMDHRMDWASDNARPRWRDDATGAGRSATQAEYRDTVFAAATLITGEPQSVDRLKELVIHFPAFPPDYRTKIWDLIELWIDSNPTDEDMASLRETIRRYALSRRARKHVEATEAVRARRAYKRLEPSELIPKYRWLFDNPWVEFSSEELEGELDHDAREEAIEQAREAAMHEVWQCGGISAVLSFATAMNSPHLAAFIVIKINPTGFCTVTAIHQVLEKARSEKGDAFLRGLLQAIPKNDLGSVLADLAIKYNKGIIDRQSLLRIAQNAPPMRTTWDVIDALHVDVGEAYWNSLQIGWWKWTQDEIEFAVKKLLKAKRPRTAFNAFHFKLSEIAASTVLDILKAIAQGEEESVPLPESYYFEKAFERLDGDSSIEPNFITQMEFCYASALVNSKRGPAKLYEQIAKEPILFVQMLSYLYRRNDGGFDPDEWKITEGARAASVRHLSFEILHHWHQLPGRGPDGRFDSREFISWMSEARRLCASHGRAEIGDNKLGELLAYAPKDDDGTWPCLIVRDFLDDICSENLLEGFTIGVINKRGVTTRHPLDGGRLEREEAAYYDGQAQKIEAKWPRTGAALREIAGRYRRDGEWHDRDSRLLDWSDI